MHTSVSYHLVLVTGECLQMGVHVYAGPDLGQDNQCAAACAAAAPFG